MILDSSLAYFLAFALRAAAFSAVLVLLPWRIVPLSVRLALAVGLLLFFAPFVPGALLGMDGSTLDIGRLLLNIAGFGTALTAGGNAAVEGGVSPGYTIFLAEIGIGLALGIAAGTGIYGAALLAGWISTLVYGEYSCPDGESEARDCRSRSLLYTACLLLCLCLLFHVPGGAALWSFFGKALLSFPYVEGFAVHQEIAAGAVISGVLVPAAETAFYLAMLAALPAFFISLLAEFFFLLYRRFFVQAFSEHLVQAVKIPLIVLFLSLALYPYADDVSLVFEQMLSESEADDVAESLRGVGG